MLATPTHAYLWCVTYQDGTDLKEFDSVRHEFAEVDHAKVKALHLLPVRAQSMRSHVVAIPEGATPIFFRRPTLTLDVVHCIGWKRVDQSVYVFLWEDGSSLLTEDLQAV